MEWNKFYMLYYLIEHKFAELYVIWHKNSDGLYFFLSVVARFELLFSLLFADAQLHNFYSSIGMHFRSER